jgi:hypothetical protein
MCYTPPMSDHPPVTCDLDAPDDRNSRRAAWIAVAVVVAAFAGGVALAASLLSCSPAADASAYDCAAAYRAAGAAYDRDDMATGDRITADADAHCPGAR